MNVLRHQVRESELDDLCQEVFLTFAQVANRLRPDVTVRAFLVGIAAKNTTEGANNTLSAATELAKLASDLKNVVDKAKF